MPHPHFTSLREGWPLGPWEALSWGKQGDWLGGGRPGSPPTIPEARQKAMWALTLPMHACAALIQALTEPLRSARPCKAPGRQASFLGVRCLHPDRNSDLRTSPARAPFFPPAPCSALNSPGASPRTPAVMGQGLGDTWGGAAGEEAAPSRRLLQWVTLLSSFFMWN